MKTMGGGGATGGISLQSKTVQPAEALQYALTQPVSVAIVGIDFPQHLPSCALVLGDVRTEELVIVTRQKRVGPMFRHVVSFPFPCAAFFWCALVLAQRARCAAAILLRAAWLIVRMGVDSARLVFAHRAFCSSEIVRRADAESLRFGLFSFVWTPVRFLPIKLPITWIT
jgi:hypothetical protein